MGIWVELHCDNRAPVAFATGGTACVSGSGNQPGAMTLKRPMETLRQLQRQAKLDGWLTAADGRMTCPNCALYWRKHPEEGPQA